MSLREFHLFFIVVACLCCTALAVWSAWMVRQGESVWYGWIGLSMGVPSAFLMAVYGVWYAKKRRQMIVV